MKKHYPVVIEQDKDGVFIIECPAFEGCRSYGETIDEALSKSGNSSHPQPQAFLQDA